MIGDTVAIEVPSTVSERDQGRTIGACEAALGDDRCSRLGGEPTADFIARVTEASASELMIELTLAAQDEVPAVRILKFSEDEPEAFRWQSVGVVIAALVLSRNQQEDQAAADPPEPPPEPEEPVKAALPAREDLSDADARAKEALAKAPDVATIDLGPLVASTASGAGVAGGAWLGGAIRLKGPLHIMASGDASFSSADAEVATVHASSLGASLGLGLRNAFMRSQFGFELSARAALQSLRVRAVSDTESGTATTGRWGGRAGVGFFWLPSRFWGIVAGGDAGLVWPPIDVDIGAMEPTRVNALIWGGYLGLRIRVNRL